MTREEAIKWFRESPFWHEDHEPFNMAIKAIEQELAIDKIRAEIMQVANQEKFYDEKWALGLRYAVKIIDKYRAESENTDGNI